MLTNLSVVGTSGVQSIDIVGYTPTTTTEQYLNVLQTNASASGAYAKYQSWRVRACVVTIGADLCTHPIPSNSKKSVTKLWYYTTDTYTSGMMEYYWWGEYESKTVSEYNNTLPILTYNFSYNKLDLQLPSGYVFWLPVNSVGSIALYMTDN